MTTKPTTSDMSLQELLLEYRSAIANLLQDHHSHGLTTAQLTAIDKRYLAAIEAHYAAIRKADMEAIVTHFFGKVEEQDKAWNEAFGVIEQRLNNTEEV